MKRLLIVRHGDTFLPGEPVRRIGARTDLPLTARGEAQAGDVAAWLATRDWRPARALSGPLRRAGRTAHLIVSRLPYPCPLFHGAWLDEVDYGPDEGRPESEVVERVGADALARWDGMAEPAPGWPIDRARRIDDCRAAVAALPHDTTLLVTSNGAARFILLAAGLDAVRPSLKLRTGAFGVIEIVGIAASLVCWDVRPGG